MNKLLLLTILLSFFGQNLAMGNTYSIKDLEILAQESNYEEFLDHALDIRPLERQDQWKLMVTAMADGFAKRMLTKSEIKKNDLLKIENLFSWPHLREDSLFKTRRIEIGLKYFGVCLKGTSPCWKELKTFWENDTSDPELGQKFAELTKDLKDSEISTWTFLENSLKSPLSEFYCKKPFVQDEVWAKLKIFYNGIPKESEFLKTIDMTLHPDCLISINKMAMERLYRPAKADDREFSYQFLSAQGKNNRDLTDFFYTIYLLENPSKGELFNYSWNRLNELSKSVIRREKVLKELSRLDPLPDQILGSFDDAKKRAILNHFNLKFPEYFHHYAQQCLNYYSGKGVFPYGNPTINCSKLMNTPEARVIIGHETVTKFKQITTL